MRSLNTLQPAVPRPAAAVIMLRDQFDPKVYWVQRSRKLAFMAGYHAFPGGQFDEADRSIPILNGGGNDDLPLRVTAIRELFEETGVLIAVENQRIGPELRRQMRADLCEGRIRFDEILEQGGLSLDASLLDEAPRWVTPPSLPRRFDTRFYVVWLPDGQDPEILPGELEDGEWIRPIEALRKWIDGEVLLVTPIISALQELINGVDEFTVRLHRVEQSERDLLESRVEMRYGIYLCPLRTPTIPPATHTNCYIVGGDELVIIDPGSPYPDQQERLDQILDRFLSVGRRLREIIITHLHPDHIGGVNHLVERYGIPVAAHALTAEAIGREIKVDRLIEDCELIVLREDRSGLEWRLRSLWTPGHARGHLSFHEERTGTLFTGDCVVGLGTVVIAPPEGDMSHYIKSLQRYLSLTRITALMPGHGPVLANPRQRIEEYLEHRSIRERQVLNALADGYNRPETIVPHIYAEIDSTLHQLAELTVLAHLEKLVGESQIVYIDGTYRLANIY
ncbi:MAG: MBL fold metallo-hydrolase [Acidobacteria bacterium]|nr:MBL fold metallo-hydrolase [Acidobacteriota bacterium]